MTLLFSYLFIITWLGCTCNAVYTSRDSFTVFPFLTPVLCAISDMRPVRPSTLSLCILLMATMCLFGVYCTSTVPSSAAPFVLALLAMSMSVSCLMNFLSKGTYLSGNTLPLVKDLRSGVIMLGNCTSTVVFRGMSGVTIVRMCMFLIADVLVTG